MPSLLIDFALRSTILLAAAFALTGALQKKAAATRHLLWSLTFIAVLLLPIFTIALPAWRILPYLSVRQTSASETTNVVVSFPPPRPSPRATRASLPTTPATIFAPPFLPIRAPAPSATHHVTLKSVSVIIYLAGLSTFIGALLAAALGLHRLKRRASLLDRSPWTFRLARAMFDLQIHGAVTLLQSNDESAMPMTWGSFRPRILLPRSANTWSEDRAHLVLLHELAHIQRNDILMDTLARFASALCWFNPLAWLAARRLRIEAEHACDDLVCIATLRAPNGLKPSTYAAELLQLACTLERPAFSVAAIAMARGNNSQLYSRIRAILDAARNRRRLSRLATFVSAVLVLAGAVTLAIAQSITPAPEPIREWSQSHHFPAGDIAPTTLESTLGGWRNLPFTLSADEETDAKTCIALAHKMSYTVDGETEFSADATRVNLEDLLKKRPNYFYAEYLLSLWHHHHHADADAAKLLDAAYKDAPVLVVQRYQLSDGSPLADTAIANFALEHNRIQNGSLDPSLELVYADLRTDSRGCIFLPAYNTVFRRNSMASPDGYACDFPTLGWFEAPQKVALLPAATVTPKAGQFEADDTRAVVSTATLLDGNTIDVVAVTRYPQDDKKTSWSPGGSPAAAPLFPPSSAMPPWHFDYGCCFAFHFAKPTGEDSHLQMRFSSPTSGVSHYSTVRKQDMDHPLFVYAAFPTKPDRVSIRLGETTGPWQTLTSYEPATKVATPDLPNQFSFEPVKTLDDGRVEVRLNHPPMDWEFRMTAIDVDARERPIFMSHSKSDDVEQEFSESKEPPLARIKSIRVEYREFHWIEFKNIATKPVAAAADPFPHPVHFDLGKFQFLPGDKITITEIRGTAETFAIGNTYQIKGTYTLDSALDANLYAYITSPVPTDSHHDPEDPHQSTRITKGTGTFTVVLPFLSKGFPHLSFYPINGGSSFSTLYFGTGESLLEPKPAPGPTTAPGPQAPVTIDPSATAAFAIRDGRIQMLSGKTTVEFDRMTLRISDSASPGKDRLCTLEIKDGALRLTREDGTFWGAGARIQIFPGGKGIRVEGPLTSSSKASDAKP